MKRLLAILLLLTLLLSLAACSNASTRTREDTKPTETEAPTTTAAPETTVLPTEPPTTPPTEPVTEDTILGDIDGNHYENADFGIACDLDESWTVSSREETASMMGATAADLTADNIESILSANGTLFGFFAMSPEGNSINITLSKLPMTLTTAELIPLMVPQLETLLTSSGFEDIVVTQITTTFLGEETDAVSVTGTVSGVEVFEKQIYIIRDNYFAALTVATVNEDTTDTLLDFFTALN